MAVCGFCSAGLACGGGIVEGMTSGVFELASVLSGFGDSFRTRSISSHGKSSGSTANAGAMAGVSQRAARASPNAKRRVRRITFTLSQVRCQETGPAILIVRPVAWPVGSHDRMAKVLLKRDVKWPLGCSKVGHLAAAKLIIRNDRKFQGQKNGPEIVCRRELLRPEVSNQSDGYGDRPGMRRLQRPKDWRTGRRRQCAKL